MSAVELYILAVVFCFGGVTATAISLTLMRCASALRRIADALDDNDETDDDLEQ